MVILKFNFQLDFTFLNIFFDNLYIFCIVLLTEYLIMNVGFTNADKGCCGTGKVEVAFLCNRFGSVCSNHSDHVFWDSFHPTEATYKNVVVPVMKTFLSKLV